MARHSPGAAIARTPHWPALLPLCASCRQGGLLLVAWHDLANKAGKGTVWRAARH